MNNITVFKQINDGQDNTYHNEITPEFDNIDFWPKTLELDENGNIYWKSCNDIDISSLYIKDNRIGIGRKPLHKYKLDVALHKNIVETGIHIGDGVYGFSFGNGSDNGFIPQIIGMSAKSDEPGLYFVSRTGDKELPQSNVPMITFDCRNIFNTDEIKRPLFGVKTNGNKSFEMLLDDKGNLHVSDIILDGISLKQLLIEKNPE